MRDGVNMDLQADKTSLKPGEKATIIVKSPIAGKRPGNCRAEQGSPELPSAISPENPVIEVPVTEEDAPNVFVSVMLIRGAQSSPQAVKMPEYRVGYLQLTVGSDANDLVIEVKPENATVKPGEGAAVTAQVNDGKGKPVANAEVTLAAVDEGVLSLMTYETPKPQDYFGAPSPLAVSTHTNFSSVITEDALVRERGNKGFVIGGGGDENEANIPTRKNFLATALWTATTVTDASGRVKASFTRS